MVMPMARHYAYLINVLILQQLHFAKMDSQNVTVDLEDRKYLVVRRRFVSIN